MSHISPTNFILIYQYLLSQLKRHRKTTNSLTERCHLIRINGTLTWTVEWAKAKSTKKVLSLWTASLNESIYSVKNGLTSGWASSTENQTRTHERLITVNWPLGSSMKEYRLCVKMSTTMSFHFRLGKRFITSTGAGQPFSLTSMDALRLSHTISPVQTILLISRMWMTQVISLPSWSISNSLTRIWIPI